MLKKGDIVIFVILALLLAGFYGGFTLYKKSQRESSTQKIAVITQDNKVIRKIDLNSVLKPETIEIDGKYKNVVLVEPGRICFKEAACPDQICVKTGWLQDIGDTAACIPDKIMIKIQGSKKAIDSVSY